MLELTVLPGQVRGHYLARSGLMDDQSCRDTTPTIQKSRFEFRDRNRSGIYGCNTPCI
jgi:hypothetical protein